MVRDSVTESQSLVSIDTVASGGMGTTERRRGTIIPVDKGNSRMLRQSINSYLGQASEVQEELTRLEKRINELVVYLDEKLMAGWDEGDAMSLEDEQMHEVEEKMSIISTTGLKVKSLLRRMEPNKDGTEQPSTIDRKRPNRISVRHTQYHALALMAYASMSNYKQALDNYYAKLTLNPQITNGHWATANNTLEEGEEGEEEGGSSNEGDDTTHTPLLEGDVILSLIKVKQRLISQEYEIHAREKRVREAHKLTSHTYQSRHNTDTDSIRSAYTCTTSPTPTVEQLYNYDVEFCSLTNPYKNDTVLNSTVLDTSMNKWNATTLNKNKRNKRKPPFSPTRCVLAFLLALVITALVAAAVFLTLFFAYYKGSLSTSTEATQILPSSSHNNTTTEKNNMVPKTIQITELPASEEATADTSTSITVPSNKKEQNSSRDYITTQKSSQTELTPNTATTLSTASGIATGSSLLKTVQLTTFSTIADTKSSSNAPSTAEPALADQSYTTATVSTPISVQTTTIPINTPTITKSKSEDNSTVAANTSGSVILDVTAKEEITDISNTTIPDTDQHSSDKASSADTTETNTPHNTTEQDVAEVERRTNKKDSIVEGSLLEEIDNANTTSAEMTAEYTSSGELPSDIVEYEFIPQEDFNLELKNATTSD